MSTHPPGEYLPLSWEGDADTEYLYGHVDAEAFFLAIGSYHGSGPNEFGTFPVYTNQPRQRWARFVFAGSDWDGPSRTLREYAEPGPGRFKVTACDPDRWERHERCDGSDTDDPCWLRQGHTGPHMAHGTWALGRWPGGLTPEPR